MKTSFENGLRAGLIFGVVSLFLLLVGFNVTAADIIGSFLKNQSSTIIIMGITPAMFNMLIYMGLIGIWAGTMGAKRILPDDWSRAIVGSSVAGSLHGVIMGAIVFIVGSLNAANIKISTYLAQLIPSALDLLMLNKSPSAAAVTYLIFFLLAGLAGGILARGFGRGGWRGPFFAWWQQRRSNITSQPSVQNVRRNPATRNIFYGILFIIVFLLPLFIGQRWNYTLGTVGIYVLLGLGLNIVVGLAGLLDLGYVAFFAIGAYTMALLTAPQPHHLMWNFWIALPIGIVLAFLAGILLGIPVLRMRGDYLAIVTLGFGEIIRILSQSDMLTSFSGGPKGVINIAGPTLFGKPFGSDIDFVYLIMLACLLIIFVTTRLQNSRVGRAWEAMREDETVARANGINTLTHKLLAFAIGAAFAGLGGALFASRNQFTGPEDHNLMVSINVLCLVIVGGMGSIPGVIAGAFALKGLPEVLRQLENYRVLTFGALLVVMMIWLPEGIIPSKRRQLEMHSETEETPLETKPGAPPGIPKEDRVSPSPAAVFPTDVKEP